MYGSTGLFDITEPFLRIDFTGHNELKYIKIFKDTDTDGDLGIMGWCASDDNANLEDSTNCVTAELTGSYTSSDLIDLSGRLIGFKATIGLSRSGLVKNIRALEVIVDSTNCEIASFSSDESI